MLAVISTNGDMATVGVYSHEHGNIASQSQASTIQTHFNLSLADFSRAADFSGGLISRLLALAPQLLHLVGSAKARLGFIVSDVIDIGDAPDAFARFNCCDTAKVVLNFGH
jgi:threonine dehydrogenase-like Zn-dependent dehydrogenase